MMNEIANVFMLSNSGNFYAFSIHMNVEKKQNQRHTMFYLLANGEIMIRILVSMYY